MYAEYKKFAGLIHEFVKAAMEEGKLDIMTVGDAAVYASEGMGEFEDGLAEYLVEYSGTQGFIRFIEENASNVATDKEFWLEYIDTSMELIEHMEVPTIDDEYRAIRDMIDQL